MGEEGILNALSFSLGSVVITQSVLTTWLIMMALLLFLWLSLRQLSLLPGNCQVILEGIVVAI